MKKTLSESKGNSFHTDSNVFEIEIGNSDTMWELDYVDFPTSASPSAKKAASEYRPTPVPWKVSDDNSPNTTTYNFSNKSLNASSEGNHLVQLSPAQEFMVDVKLVTKPPFEVEYAPWINEVYEHSFLYGSFTELQNDFDLKSMKEEVESVELPETDEGRWFFRPTFKAFKTYGESYNEEKLQAAKEFVRPLSQQVTEKVSACRETKLQKPIDGIVSGRHEAALKYAKRAHELNLIESEWLCTIINGGVIDFFTYHQTIQHTEEMSQWSTTRCRKFIIAMIPSIMYSINFEEVLIDFLDDFFLPHVVVNENDSLEGEVEQGMFIKKLIHIADNMIKYHISPTIIENYLSYIKPLLTELDTDMLYDTLVHSMSDLIIPNPHIRPERKKPNREDYTIGEEETYQEELKKYHDQVKKDKCIVRVQEDLIDVKKIHKSRSFDTLKILVSLFPEPILRSESYVMQWRYLKMPSYQRNALLEETNTATTTEKEKGRREKINEMIFGPDAHTHQDFFDALFFSHILHACLNPENTITIINDHLRPFLTSCNTIANDSLTIGGQYLNVVNKFIKIAHFNVVANVLPQIIHSRRYLLAYLIRDGAQQMGIAPSEVQSYAIKYELLSLFESLHLYQVVESSDAAIREETMKMLMKRSKEIAYHIPIIYFTYNPISYQAIGRIIEEISKEIPNISNSKLNGYFEIFAMAKNVDCLPITERKVLKFKHMDKSPEDTIFNLESHNQMLDLRPALPENYEAIYDWNMSRRLKNLSLLDIHLDYPYGLFASRVLLARQFGISFDSSHFIPQLSENFTWLECIDFVNFFLEREAQFLIDRAYPCVDNELYQVYRVYDSQKNLHQSRQLSDDEPTHHINLLIEAGLRNIPVEEADQIRSKYSDNRLFQEYKQALAGREPVELLALSREAAVKMLRWFVDDNGTEKIELECFFDNVK